ncbi:MAG: thioredoxin [Rhodospirillaceae bacterium]|nr:thioredoxin [Rhodospirillaceae bacterium]MCA8931176.1 thioredoxin [Rhodospirillaceae bacterium]
MDVLLNAGAENAADLIKDTSTASFTADVIEASMSVPVLVDFWAPWCGPCKQLGPVLEKAVRQAGGKVKLVKLNIDENQALAGQMRIQSIPTVYAFFQGRPVDYFQGALPESQVLQFIERLASLGGKSSPLDDALAQAKAMAEAGDWQSAGSLYSQVLQHDAEQIEARAGLARALLELDRAEEARQVLDQASPKAKLDARIVSVQSALDLADQAKSATGDLAPLLAKVAADPADHESRFELAQAQFAAGAREDAVDSLLEIVRRDRTWNEEAARKELVKYFEAFGPTDPLTLSARRRLSSILFS